MRLLFLVGCLSFCCLSQVSAQKEIEFSRIIIYDVRGINQEETAIILEQKGERVKIWLKNYLGQREGEMPAEEYQAGFKQIQSIQQFALQKKYRGKLLRAHAAKGSVTLVWKDQTGKQIKTIRYYAPEHTLEDFRQAFNRLWAWSRYAVLSLSTVESPKQEYVEEALYFLSGAGWMTAQELESVISFHQQHQTAQRLAAAIWGALDKSYPDTSLFFDKKYLQFCMRQSLLRIGQPSADFLKSKLNTFSNTQRSLAQEILDQLASTAVTPANSFSHPQKTPSF